MASALRHVPLLVLTFILTVVVQVKADALPEYGEPVSIFGFHAEGSIKWSSAFDRENPGQLTVHLWDSDGEKEHVVNEPSTVIAVIDAHAQISMQGQADASASDEAMLALSFENENDEPIWFTFQNGAIPTEVGHIEVEGYTTAPVCQRAKKWNGGVAHVHLCPSICSLALGSRVLLYSIASGNRNGGRFRRSPRCTQF